MCTRKSIARSETINYFCCIRRIRVSSTTILLNIEAADMLQTPDIVCFNLYGKTAGLGLYCLMADDRVGELQWKRDVVDSRII